MFTPSSAVTPALESSSVLCFCFFPSRPLELSPLAPTSESIYSHLGLLFFSTQGQWQDALLPALHTGKIFVFWATWSCSLLLPSGLAWPQSQTFHFPLTVDFRWAYFSFRLVGFNKSHFIMGSCGWIVTRCPMVKHSSSNRAQEHARRYFSNDKSN